MEIEILSSAEIDWFDLYRKLGEGFDASFVKGVELLAEFPELGIRYRVEPFRRLLISESQIGIFYSISGNRIWISAVEDLRRDPAKIDEKLKTLLP